MLSKSELLAKFKARQEQKFGGREGFQKHLSEGRKSINKALKKYKEPNEHEKLHYQKKIGRAYSE